MTSEIDGAPPPARDGAFAFIDLARLGRTDWRSTGKALLKIVGWQVLMVAVAAGGGFLAERLHLPVRFDNAYVEIVLLALTTAAWYAGLYGAVVRSQRRPFLSLLSTDLRLDWRRVGLGGLLWVVSWVPVVLFGTIWGSIEPATAPDVAAPVADTLPSPALLVAALLTLPIFPFQAAAEELVFRGWLTQTLGQLVRRPWLVAVIVALVFAAGHLFAGGLVGFIVYVTMSLGFSALSLLDRRLELAIGLHAANNIFVVLVGIFMGSPDAGQGLIHYPDAMPWTAAPAILLQYGTAFAIVWWLKRSPPPAP